MRTMYASNRATLNCVAVDVVAKTLIVAGWKCAMDYGKIGIQREEPNENLNDRQFSVYNCASQHLLSLELLVYEGQYLVRQYPFERFVWLPSGGVTLCKFMNYFRVSFILFSRPISLLTSTDVPNGICNQCVPLSN